VHACPAGKSTVLIDSGVGAVGNAHTAVELGSVSEVRVGSGMSVRTAATITVAQSWSVLRFRVLVPVLNRQYLHMVVLLCVSCYLKDVV
jgi:hypothetical protein